MQGYKVFNPDWTTNHSDIVFEVGETYRVAGEPKLGKKGLHFCEEPAGCLCYYEFDLENHVCLVEASGDIDESNGRACTNELTVLREISWREAWSMIRTSAPRCRIRIEDGLTNVGTANTGFYNVGRHNQGKHNTGNSNSGSRNVGNENSGNGNVGDLNEGERNSGSGNAGDLNAGCGNGGDGNAGDRNMGRRNAGSSNTGNWNAGSWNTGHRNAGSFNAGNFNIGDWNAGKHRIGCFCTKEDTSILMFDQPSEWTMRDWSQSRAKKLLARLPRDYAVETDAVYDDPSDEDYREFAQRWWESLSGADVASILLLPNFDAEKFLLCTGIDVRKSDNRERVGRGPEAQASDPKTDEEYENERYRPLLEPAIGEIDLLDLL